MPRGDGPNTRNQKQATLYRGSKRRVERLSPFAELPATFWIVLAIGLLMLALCGVLISTKA
jgi:hypothetical protein